MNDFTYYSPTEFVFGRDAETKIGSYAAAHGYKRALVVYGGGSAVRSGLLGRVESSLEAAATSCVELGGVRPNPEVERVRDGIRIAREERIDLVVAVGGGSVIDCAKAVAFGALYDGDVWDFFCGKARVQRALPIFCVLTIPAAGSEASSSCVISNDALRAKRGTNGDVFRPQVSFMNPELTFTLPSYQTAAGITDMVAHICERWFSGVGAVPVTDHIAASLIRTLMDAAARVLSDPCDYDARADIMWAGMLAHNDIAGCGRGLKPEGRAGGWESHALEHELSALDASIVHGAGLAVMMPAWMRYVWRVDPSRFLQFALEVFDIEPIDDGEEAVEDAVCAAIDELQAFFIDMGMPKTLGELGIELGDVDALVESLRASKGDVFGAFMPLRASDARAIYLSAFSDPALVRACYDDEA